MILEKQLTRPERMLIRRISFFDEFKCTGAECPVNCCMGWKIPVDYDVYMRYLNEKGLFGAKLRCLLKRNEDTASFRSFRFRCPFWDNDRLCSIQKKRGSEYMPAVCAQFPRQLYHLGFFCEETLYLACPEAAKLFLGSLYHEEPFAYRVMEGEVSYEINTTNDDGEFLGYLMKSRDGLAQMLREGMRYDSMAILDYGRDARNACLAGKDFSTEFPDPLSYHADAQYEMDLQFLDRLIFDGFYHANLRVVSPMLYQLCRKYLRKFYRFGKLDGKAAEKKFADLQQDLYQKFPLLDKLLNRYFEYYLLTNFFDIYEDYSFSKCLVYGMAKTNMIRLFLALYAEKKERVALPEIAELIALYERRAPQIKDALKKVSY